MPPAEGPNDGHRFHLTVITQGSYAVAGDPEHRDAELTGDPWHLTVRAWDLPAALRKAAEAPLAAWDRDDPTDPADQPRAEQPAEIDGVDVDAASEALTMLTCPWRLGVGICATGCRDEPVCQTSEPAGGWAAQLRAASEEPADG